MENGKRIQMSQLCLYQGRSSPGEGIVKAKAPTRRLPEVLEKERGGHCGEI